MLHKAWLVAIPGSLALWSSVSAADLSVGALTLRPGGSGEVVVSGSITQEATFGWTIMLRLVPREGSRGELTFTVAGDGLPGKRTSFAVIKTPRGRDSVLLDDTHVEGVDIRQLGDVWPGVGSFTRYDTQLAGASNQNGAVDDNGTFLAAEVDFSGPLAAFPVVASADARGVWDVALSTPVGQSGWEGVQTKLMAATITVSPDACRIGRDCQDRDPCTVDTCEAGTCVHVVNDHNCGKPLRTKKRGHRSSSRPYVSVPDPRAVTPEENE